MLNNILENKDFYSNVLRNQLQEVRKKSGLTQQQVGNVLAKNQIFISNSESGRRTLEIADLIALSQIYGFDAGDVLDNLSTLLKKTAENNSDSDNTLENSAVPLFFKESTTANNLIAKLLKECRTAAGFTQEQVATVLGETQSFISNCESGRRRVSGVELLGFCELYNVRVSALMDELQKQLERE